MLAVCVAGCFPNRSENYRCSPEGQCPSGRVCDEAIGFCVQMVDAPIDAIDGPPDVPADVACPVDQVLDDFNDMVTGAAWTKYGYQGASAAETATGHLVITCASNQSQSAKAGYETVAKHDLTNHRVVVYKQNTDFFHRFKSVRPSLISRKIIQ